MRAPDVPAHLYNLYFDKCGEPQVWWMPDGGTPARLPWGNGSIMTNEQLPERDGRLWRIDGSFGRGVYLRCNAELRTPASVPVMKPGLSLGLLMLILNADDRPGTVTLIGKGKLAWIQVEFPYIRWEQSSLLNYFAAQVDALPPGEYTVLVETSRGSIETQAAITASGETPYWASRQPDINVN